LCYRLQRQLLLTLVVHHLILALVDCQILAACSEEEGVLEQVARDLVQWVLAPRTLQMFSDRFVGFFKISCHFVSFK